MDVLEATVTRFPTYRPVGRPGEAARDVTAIEVLGVWSHGQRQHVRVLLPSESVLGLVTDLLGAVAPGVDRPMVAGSPVPPRVEPVVERTAVPVSSVAGTPAAPVRRVPERPALVELLEQRAARQFGGNEKRRGAWLRPHLDRHHVEELDQLPTAVLADLFNGLAAHQQK